MSDTPFMQEFAEKTLREAMESAARKIAGTEYESRSTIEDLVKQRAVELFMNDPEVMAAFKAKLMACIERIDVEQLNRDRRRW